MIQGAFSGYCGISSRALFYFVHKMFLVTNNREGLNETLTLSELAVAAILGVIITISLAPTQ